MHRRFFLRQGTLALGACAGLCPVGAHAALPKPRLTIKGDLLLEAKFVDLETDGWGRGRGRWRVEKGEVTGEQIDPEPLYHAGISRGLEYNPGAGIIEGEVKFDGANACWLGLGGGGAFFMTPGRLSFHNDSSEMTRPGIPAADNEIRQGKWHSFLIEYCDIEVAGEREGAEISTEHTMFKQPRSGISFVVASDVKRGGGSASLRNLKIYKATANPKWKKPKEPRRR